MTPFLASLAGALICTGIVLTITGLRKTPVKPPAPRRRAPLPQRWHRLPRTTKALTAAALIAGLVIAITTGWLIALIALPAAALVLPALLSGGDAQHQIRRLEGMEEWCRSLSDVLAVGVGIEQAINATLASTPDAIKPEVTTLANRLRARWAPADAIRAFADDLDDATGDLIAASLLLGTQRRGAGLSAVIKDLAVSVADEVAVRRRIEADREKPRTTARWVTLITVGVLAAMFFNGSYVAPYRTPLGQAIFITLVTLYFAILIWMKRMTIAKPLPRFVGTSIAHRTKENPR